MRHTTRQPGWTFYPKGQPRITLTVVYMPGLDTLAGTGYLEVGTITAYVNWVNCRIFNAGDQPLKGTLRLADPELIS